MRSLVTLFFIFCSCIALSQNQFTLDRLEKDFSECSDCKGDYIYFNSCQAINKISDIENEHLIDFNTGASRYYGTIWRQQAEATKLEIGISLYQSYLEEIQPYVKKPDSMHCTIYAYEGLKAGLNQIQQKRLEKIHKQIWKSREHAGWSIGYILVKYFDWKAYLIIHPDAKEYNHCLESYKKNKSYPVWKQPDIPLEAFYIIGSDDEVVNDLLVANEFGWGFSEQGIHTWLTRYKELKECNWLGAPSKKYQEYDSDKPLFISTKFEDYKDYDSHVMIFPPK
ncbi:hypothetical protein [uncultured Aquimarina sp.]|uniref:hypothetical protein n=1 Tax=uncultured Aquimarina sp. TaxID=575652 RepID=UPI0026124031|nr:hypothetical protein [uncultured Aquimarina sp.]